MERTFFIEPCAGMSADVRKGELITVIDVDGGQVVDFFAEI